MELEERRRPQKLFFWQWDKTLYTPLTSTKAFRLLLVQAGKGKDPVRTVLQLARLDAHPPPLYETISYCWGDSWDVDTIHLNEKELPVTASSAAALRCVRLPDRDRVVWIDAICINQGNLEERAQQVAMMTDVYARSNCNLIYLGEQDENTEQAVESIKTIVADIEKRTDNFQSTGDTPFESLEHRFFYEDVSCNVDEQALLTLFSNDWFRRVWAFQEAALAPINICFLGQTCINLLDVVRVAQWIYFQSATYSSDLKNSRGLWCAGELQNIIDKALGFHYSTKKLYLSTLLAMSCELRASDPRDRVYGLLGLWIAGRPQRQDLPLGLVPDYRKPVEHVFRDATRMALMETDDFDIWRGLSHRSEEDLLSKSMPSWTRNLTQPWDRVHDPQRLNGSWFITDKDWWARLPKITFENDETILASGFCVGNINDVTSIYDTKLVNLQTWTDEVITKANRLIKEQVITYDDLAAVLLAGTGVEGDRVSQEDALDFFLFLQVLKREESIPSLLKCTSATPRYIRAAARFQEGMMYGCRNRRMFITNTSYIGVGPRLARVGDVVVIVHGSQLPLVLRPFDGAYRLVGQCFVAGVMEGEAVRKHIENGAPDVVFRIC